MDAILAFDEQGNAVEPEWPEADYGWKVTHLLWVPFHVLDVVFGVPLVFAIFIAFFAI